MGRGQEKIVIRGNEFYEIDLECEKKKREGKPCGEERRTAERQRAKTEHKRY